jgi:hypothetical protein
MIAFDFTVNPSFLITRSHPITVPKSQVEYRRIEAELGDARRLRVTDPDGSYVWGKLYEGTAGYGPYYQIRMDGRPNDAFFGLRPHTRVRVSMKREESFVSVNVDRV